MSNFTKTNNRSFASAAGVTYDLGLREYMLKVFNHMGIALAITGFAAFFVASSPALIQAIFGTPLQWLVMFSPLIFVFVFSAKINSISAAAAKNYLWIFAVLMGISLAPIFLIYTGASVARAFFVSSSIFGIMSIYGHSTKKDLTGMGSFMFMGLIGIIIASIVNIFLKSSGLEFAISGIAVIVFTGLTAWDVQKIKNVYYQAGGNAEAISKSAVIGALTLYMDFINLFIHLLRLVGDRRN